MKFILENPKNKKIDTQDLLDDLALVSKKLSKSPTIEEYNTNGKYESSVIIRRFGTWNDALHKVGLTISNKQWSEEELFNNLQEVWIKKGKQPARRDMDDKNFSKISSGAYLRHFDTWQNALNQFVKYINSEDSTEIEVHPKVDSYTHKTKRDIPPGLRFKVLNRDCFRCCACGATSSTVELEIDHIIPYSKGGETVLENLQILCKRCNRGAGNMIKNMGKNSLI